MSNDPKTLSQERFNQFAQNYVRSKTHAKGAELDRLIDIAKPQLDHAQRAQQGRDQFL